MATELCANVQSYLTDLKQCSVSNGHRTLHLINCQITPAPECGYCCHQTCCVGGTGLKSDAEFVAAQIIGKIDINLLKTCNVFDSDYIHPRLVDFIVGCNFSR